MTIGKNLNGIDLKYDYSNLITKLYPRGSGSSPSELLLDNPPYYPAAQNLQLAFTNNYGAYFTMPNPYSTYAGFTKSGDPLPSGYMVGMDTWDAYNHPYVASTTTNNVFVASLGSPGDAVAQMFYMSGHWSIYSVSLWLQRSITPPQTQWTTQPRFIVGLWSAIASASIPNVFQQAGYHVPYQGPQNWCYGNLLSISTEGGWYEFPFQPTPYAWTGWVAIVIMPYPTSNKQWSVNDYLVVGGSPALTSSANCYGMQCRSGLAQKNWMMAVKGATTESPFVWQLANKLKVIDYDVTAQFKQAIPAQPGRYIFSANQYKPSGGWAANQFVFYYKHAPYLINWDAYNKYGKFEGTYKNDAITTQSALLLAGSQYLQSASQPAITVSLSAADLYDLDPDKNWAEELTIGSLVTVIDDTLGTEETCLITKIEKQDLTQPHALDTFTLNNVHMSTQKLMAQAVKNAQRSPKYQQGQTVETPYTTAGSVSSGSPAEMQFYIRDATTLTHSVRLTIDTPGAFQVYVDGNDVGSVTAGMNEIDVIDYLKQSHNGQPTPGIHTVEVHSA